MKTQPHWRTCLILFIFKFSFDHICVHQRQHRVDCSRSIFTLPSQLYFVEHFDFTFQCLFSFVFSIHFRLVLYSICSKLIVPMLKALPLFYSIEAIDFIIHTRTHIRTWTKTHEHIYKIPALFPMHGNWVSFLYSPSILLIFMFVCYHLMFVYFVVVAHLEWQINEPNVKSTLTVGDYLWIIYENHHIYLNMGCMWYTYEAKIAHSENV